MKFEDLLEKHEKKKKLVTELSMSRTNEISSFSEINIFDYFISRYKRDVEVKRSHLNLIWKLPFYLAAYPTYKYTNYSEEIFPRL